MISPGAHSNNLVSRQLSMRSAMSEDAIPTEDPKNTVDLLFERFIAWKYVVDTFEDYIKTTEKVQRSQAKEYQRVLKTLQGPLRAGHHFDQKVGGIASLFENMRQNIHELVNSYLETEKNIKESTIPIIEQLRKEIKNQSKEFSSVAVKGAKDVEKARNLTQKYIELLGQNVAGFESSGSRLHSTEDPYVLHRGVLHHLHKQIIEENSQRQVLVTLQNNFHQFEQHVIEVIQTSLSSLTNFLNTQAQSQQEYYSDVMRTAQAIPLDFEWNGFLTRSSDILVDPSTSDRSIDTTTFPNQDHKSTCPIIAGTLERKSRNKLSFAGFTTGYYVVTMSKFLHEFKDEDFAQREPDPELSIYLPEATIGVTSGEKFSVKGKDVSKGLSSKLSGNSDLHFKAASPEEAQRWVQALQGVIGQTHMAINNPIDPNVEEETKTTSSPPIYSEENTVVITEKKILSSAQSQTIHDEIQSDTAIDTPGPLSSNLVETKVSKPEESQVEQTSEKSN
ncbi:putative ph domain-containing protein [Erysiphe necator]|uniref:Putative ph domain-containing protein n=1 Tax=Uncinula necator TaxID=52586 RepID=A0A0B1PBA3_UNCNE|nr:putative ph domain-containing protein [Erysiphe necator]